jgi:hypothetical protein
MNAEAECATAGRSIHDQQKRQESGVPLRQQGPTAEHGTHALNPRVERYSPDTIRDRLNMRDFMDTMRASGIDTGGPPAISRGDRQAFANELDKFLARGE